jgi:IS4 transposase
VSFLWTPLGNGVDKHLKNDRYTCYITPLSLSAPDIQRLYRRRAICENRIKELKDHYNPNKKSHICFDGTQASLLLMTI